MSSICVIAGAGEQTSIGLNVRANLAAVQAGLNAFKQSNYLLGLRQGESLKLARLETLHNDLPVVERMKFMAANAAREALAKWQEAASPGLTPPMSFIISVPPERPGFGTDLGAQLFREVLSQLPIVPHKRFSGLVRSGHSGILGSLEYIAKAFDTGDLEIALIGGVECYHQIQTLHWLELQKRLLLEDQPNGFVPGEGAAFVFVCTKSMAHKLNLPPMAEVLAVGHGIERSSWSAGQPLLGHGLTDAFESVFSCLEGSHSKVTLTYCDLNGESWRADEWGYAYVRTGIHHTSPLNLCHPVSNWGDLGAASAGSLLALASCELPLYYAKEDLALIWTACDYQPYRAACILRSGSNCSL